ncbi:hypothetical protein EG68_09415 [Paragonimus skrjabini miyazakii]|uniref:XPG N-terminal domain-containing protein n=1 Tax=Paragonimus skrjabini miyazakii TaxID=59628 RepID=A0A8S9YGR2_9TREM|nr:hypothetical protein EG68_09415 [Paragonimus skrjabini miyazakii]
MIGDHLLTILDSDYNSFTLNKLCNTKVVIDALDFSAYMFKGLEDIYGGQHLAYVLRLKQVFGSCLKCGVTPYFVFPNGCEYKEDAHPAGVSLLSTLLSVVNFSNFPAITSDYCTTRAVASLAAYLRCPILASNTQYFFMIPDIQSRHENCPAFLPLQLTEWTPVLSNGPADEHDAFLPTQALSMQLSQLFDIPFDCVPILSVLFHSDSLSHPHIPLLPRPDDKSQTDKSVQERLYAIITLISGFSKDCSNWLSELIPPILSDDTGLIFQHLADVFSSHVYSPTLIGKKMIDSCMDSSPTHNHNLIDFREHRADDLIDNKTVDMDHLCRILTGNYLDDGKIGVSVGWPRRLVQAYRQSQILPTLFSPTIASCTDLASEYATSNDGIEHSFTYSLRILFHRLLVDFTTDSESIEFKGDSVDDLLIKLLQLPRPLDPSNPDWLLGWALALALWYRKCPRSEFGSQSNLDENPLILSVAAVAVANVINVESLDESLCSQYNKLILLLERECASTLARNPRIPNAHRPEIVHQFVGLRSIYDHLCSLVCFLNSMFEHEHKCTLFNFLPCWMLFPSGRLVYYLTLHLELQAASIRRDQRRTCTDQSNALTDMFVRLIGIANLLLLSSGSCTLDSPNVQRDVCRSLTLSPSLRSSPSSDLDSLSTTLKDDYADTKTAVNNEVSSLRKRRPLMDCSNQTQQFTW